MQVIAKYLRKLGQTSGVLETLRSEGHFVLVRRVDAAVRDLVLVHEADEADHDCLSRPGDAPRFRMVVTHAEADAHVRLEAATWSQHEDSRRLERVLLGEYDLAHVVATAVRFIKAKYKEVPLEDVVLVWASQEILQIFLLCNASPYLLVLFHESHDGVYCCHSCSFVVISFYF